MAVDVDFKAGPRILVPDIPALVHKPSDSRNGGQVVHTSSPERELRSRYKTVSPAERESLQQQNFGFFENLYGPQQELRKQHSLARRAEMDSYLHEQMAQNQAKKMGQRFKDRYSGLLPDQELNTLNRQQNYISNQH